MVTPEILDELPAEDVRALRSRRDLRVINGLMGNERWIESRVGGQEGEIVELGAGSGELCRRLWEQGHAVVGMDLQARPPGLEDGIRWKRGNFFEHLAGEEAEVVVGSLILHHFEGEELRRLGEELGGRRELIFAEPFRSRISLLEGYALFPVVNAVTRHDMIVSIRAGFRRGELAGLLGLGEDWVVEERVTVRGALWFHAKRN